MSGKQNSENVLFAEDAKNSDTVISKCNLNEPESFEGQERDFLKYANQRSSKFHLTDPIFIEDIRNLILRSVVGSIPFPLLWSRLPEQERVSRTVLIEIRGLNANDASMVYNGLFNKPSIFIQKIKIMSTHSDFANELSTQDFGTEYYSETNQKCSLFDIEKSTVKTTKSRTDGKLTKLHLLLKPIQLAMENYPLHYSVYNQRDTTDYSFTQDKYDPVTEDSPMFAMDCEMSQNYSDQQELVRIAIVNENLETKYHSFVKPQVKIKDYKTPFTGVTEETLKDVKTTLRDVQKKIKHILPSDAILCGHSLHSDLHCLKLIHPYVIDTSNIFNQHGIRQPKQKLKILARIHLKEVVQEGSHNPIEDSNTAMKLVQFRLKNQQENGKATFSGIVESNGFLSKISESSKRVCLIGKEDYLKNYYKNKTDGITFVHMSCAKEIMKTTVNNSQYFDLTMSHLDASNFSIEELNNEIKQAYDSLSEKTLFIVIMSNVLKSKDEHFKHNFGTIVLKTPFLNF